MNRPKLSAVPDDKPVRFSVDLPAAVYRDLVAYAGQHVSVAFWEEISRG
jgi:hypothetical protein